MCPAHRLAAGGSWDRQTPLDCVDRDFVPSVVGGNLTTRIVKCGDCLFKEPLPDGDW